MTIIKPIKINSYKATTTYRVGIWLVKVERMTSSTHSCGLTKTINWSNWSAINTETQLVSDMRSGSGGIKKAAESLSR